MSYYYLLLMTFTNTNYVMMSGWGRASSCQCGSEVKNIICSFSFPSQSSPGQLQATRRVTCSQPLLHFLLLLPHSHRFCFQTGNCVNIFKKGDYQCLFQLASRSWSVPCSVCSGHFWPLLFPHGNHFQQVRFDFCGNKKKSDIFLRWQAVTSWRAFSESVLIKNNFSKRVC